MGGNFLEKGFGIDVSQLLKLGILLFYVLFDGFWFVRTSQVEVIFNYNGSLLGGRCLHFSKGGFGQFDGFF